MGTSASLAPKRATVLLEIIKDDLSDMGGPMMQQVAQARPSGELRKGSKVRRKLGGKTMHELQAKHEEDKTTTDRK